MRTEITIGTQHYVYNAPEGVHLVGVTVFRSGMNFSTISGLTIDGEGAVDEEIILEDGTKIIFHYYSMPALAPLMAEFAPFAGMKFMEIKVGDLYLFQTV